MGSTLVSSPYLWKALSFQTPDCIISGVNSPIRLSSIPFRSKFWPSGVRLNFLVISSLVSNSCLPFSKAKPSLSIFFSDMGCLFNRTNRGSSGVSLRFPVGTNLRPSSVFSKSTKFFRFNHPTTTFFSPSSSGKSSIGDSPNWLSHSTALLSGKPSSAYF